MSNIEHIWDTFDDFMPEISDEELAARMATITILTRNDDGLLFLLDHNPHPRNASMLWNATYKNEVKDFIEVSKIEMNFACGYHAFFTPSIAEVMSQIPEELLPNINACYINASVILIHREGHRHRAPVVLGII